MQVLVYSTSWCRDCQEAKRFLDDNGIAYTEIDIDYDRDAEQAVLVQTGKRAVPQFVIDGEWVQPYHPDRGFLYDEMRARFGLYKA
jgi:glutaredoxin